MQPINTQEKICRIETSGKGDLCCYFALANCIGALDPQTRKRAYENMGLTEEKATRMLSVLMSKFEKRYEEISKLEVDVDMILRYKRAVLGSFFLDSDETSIQHEFSQDETKQQMIEDYKDFLFCGKRDEVKNFNEYDFQKTDRCLYDLKEFAELLELKEKSESKTGPTLTFLDVLDDSKKFQLLESRDEYYQGKKRQLLVYQPSCYQKFIGLAIQEKRTEWRPEEESLLRQGLRAIPDLGESILRTILEADYGIASASFLSQNTLEFLISKILPDHKLAENILDLSEENRIRIFLNYSHFIAYARKSEIEQLDLKTQSESDALKTEEPREPTKPTKPKNPYTRQREEAIEKNKTNDIYTKAIFYGTLGFGATLLCASALGFGVISAPVLGVAVGVGVGAAIVGSNAIQPIARQILNTMGSQQHLI